MKKFFVYAMIGLIFIIGLNPTIAYALPAGDWASGIKIQNLDPANAANLAVDLYDEEGTLEVSITTTANGNPLIAPIGGSIELYMPAYVSVPSGQYSAVVSSSTAVGAVVTSTNYESGMADSYASMEPSTAISIPYVYHNHNHYHTEITLLNTTNNEATVVVNFKEPSSSVAFGDSGSHEKSINITIAGNGSITIDTSTAQFNDLGWFIGAASLTSTQPLTAVANQYRVVGSGDTKGNLMISSRGLSSADSGTQLVVPSLYKQFIGASGTWQSGITIQNPNDSTASVQVVFTADPDMPAWTGTKSLTINANDSVELYLPGVILDSEDPIPDMFKGSAIITSDVSIVANVQHTNYSGANGYGVGMGYTAFSQGGKKLSLPSLYNWPSGAGVWISGIKVQNLTSTSVVFKATFVPDPDSVSQFTGTASNIALSGYGATELYFGAAFLDGGEAIPSGWKGSAIIEVTTGDSDIAATVIHTNYGRHVANMYTAIVIPE